MMIRNSLLNSSWKYWWASHLLENLGYRNMDSFEGVLFKIAITLADLEISFIHNLEACLNEETGKKDCKLSRLCCYLAVLFSDPKKEAARNLRYRILEKTD
jgi:hypothetical protein